MPEKKTHPCRSCGKEMKDEFLVCPFCGTPKELLCTNCGKQLEEDFQNCPYCGEPVRRPGKKRQAMGQTSDLTGKIAAVLTVIGAFLFKVGKAIMAGAVLVFNWLKKISQKAIDWIKGLDWSGLKETSGRFFSSIGAFFKKIADGVRSQDWDGAREKLSRGAGSAGTLFQKTFTWLKEISGKAWSLMKNIYNKLRDLISGTILKKMDPEKSRRTAAIILAGGALAILLLCAVIFLGSGEPSQPTSGETGATEGVTQADTQKPVDPSEQRWLVMVYADADDDILEEDIYFDLNEIESAGSTDRVQVVAQIDRYTEAYQGDGDWTTARRYEISQDADLNTVASKVVEDLGEVNMGSADTLVDFATWAIETYPADRHVLILSDHGAGWIGGWTDNDPKANQVIWLNDLNAALGTITQETGIGKFELVGMDACLMGMMEIYDMLAAHANYAVASEEVEPALGWAYGDFLGKLNERPEMSGAELAGAIVEGYLSQDLRIQDDQARKELLAQFNVKDDIPADVLADEMGDKMTLSAVDLSALPDLHSAFNDLLLGLKESDKGVVADARGYAQAFENIFNDKKPAPFIDLGSFLSILSEKSEDTVIDGLIAEVQAAYQQAIIAERHGPERPGSTGMSIHFPISEHYWNEGAYDYTKYPVRADLFAENSLWDDYLAYHYAGKDFGTGIPDAAERTRAPGQSEMTVSIPVVTPGTVPADDTSIHVQAEVTGEHIAYIYAVAMFRYEDRILMYLRDFVPADENREVGGVVFPVWERENGNIKLDFNMLIEPTVILDGKTAVFAVIEPDTYARTPEERIYAVKGFYINQDSGEETSARMYFNNSGEHEMRNIVGYYGSVEDGIQTRLIKPRKGDQFRLLDTWWTQDESGAWVDTLNDGHTLTFGDEPFAQGAAPKYVEKGTYFVGVSAVDMDGNQFNSFAPVVVE